MTKFLPLLGILMFLTLPASAQPEDTQTQAQTQEPLTKIMAITFHADWCNSCKILNPMIKEARSRADLDDKGILFITLDLTNETRRAQAKMMAETLGISDFYARNDNKTGFMLVVDTKTRQALGKITKEIEPTNIEKILLEQVKGS